jgi:hypothetical protein
MGVLSAIKEYKDDFEYLFFVGLPTGIICIVFADYFDFTFLF